MANNIDIVLRMAGAAQVQRELNGVRSAFSSISSAWSSFTGVLAAAGITSAVRSMLKSAEEARVAAFRLSQSLTATGQASNAVVDALQAQASALSSLTGVGGSTINSVQAILVSMGATADQVERLTPLVLDLSAAMGTDATTAAKQLGGALDGQEVSLGKINIKVRDFDDLLAQLNGRVRGQAVALMEAKGPLAAMANEFGNLSEAVGEVLNQWASPLFRELATAFKIARLDFTGTGDPSVYPSLFAPSRSGLFPLNSPTASPTSTPGIDEEEAAIAAEIERQASAAQALRTVQADLNNQYAFRKALIESDPFMGEVERQEALARVMRDELPVLQQREDLLREEFDRQLRADPGRTLETTIEAERQLGDAQLERLRITQRLEAIGQSGTFGGALRSQVRALKDDFGNLAVSMARVTFDTVTAGVQGLAGALTAVITGAQTAGQAFLAFGRQMLTQFISSILTAVLYAEVAIPILTALGVVSGGVNAATGAGVTTAAVASTVGAVMGMVGHKEGGYTGDGPVDAVAGTVHRGEFVVPAWRTRELGVANLDAMAFGGGGAASGGDPMRVVIVDDRRSAQQLMRDPRFRSFVVDLAQS